MSALAQAVSAVPDTPRAYLLHLCSYITDDRSVANAVNRQFGTRITVQRVAEVRATLSKRRPSSDHVGLCASDPGYDDSDAVARRRIDAFYGSEALAKALRSYSGASA